MNRRLRFAVLAAAELAEAVRWYDAQRTGLGSDLFNQVDRVLTLLNDNPELGPTIDQGVRQFPLKRFPYRVVYRVEEAEFVVIAFAHTSRRTFYWRDRI